MRITRIIEKNITMIIIAMIDAKKLTFLKFRKNKSSLITNSWLFTSTIAKINSTQYFTNFLSIWTKFAEFSTFWRIRKNNDEKIIVKLQITNQFESNTSLDWKIKYAIQLFRFTKWIKFSKKLRNETIKMWQNSHNISTIYTHVWIIWYRTKSNYATCDAKLVKKSFSKLWQTQSNLSHMSNYSNNSLFWK